MSRLIEVGKFALLCFFRAITWQRSSGNNLFTGGYLLCVTKCYMLCVPKYKVAIVAIQSSFLGYLSISLLSVALYCMQSTCKQAIIPLLCCKPLKNSANWNYVDKLEVKSISSTSSYYFTVVVVKLPHLG